MKETTIIAIIIGVAMSFLGVIALIAYGFSSYSCVAKYADFNPKFGIITGCMIEYNSKRIPAENFRLID